MALIRAAIEHTIGVQTDWSLHVHAALPATGAGSRRLSVDFTGTLETGTLSNARGIALWQPVGSVH